jgi:hypothetical protein
MWSKTVELGGDTIILPLLVTTDLLGQGLVIVRVPLYRPSLLHAHALVGGARRACGRLSFLSWVRGCSPKGMVFVALLLHARALCPSNGVVCMCLSPTPRPLFCLRAWAVGCSPFPPAPLHACDPPPMSCLRDPRPCPTSGPLCTSTPPRPTARQLYRCPPVAPWTPWCPCPPWHRYVL